MKVKLSKKERKAIKIIADIPCCGDCSICPLYDKDSTASSTKSSCCLSYHAQEIVNAMPAKYKKEDKE